MSARSRLPDFTRPPVTEVVLGVQADPVERLVAPYLGLFWSEVKHAYPSVEVQGALEPEIERFGAPPATAARGFKVMERPETPRCWFIAEGGRELLQLQQDRLIHNWRKRAEEDSYPRYPHVRESFRSALELLEAFLKREDLGTFVPNQCEVTYINQIKVGKGFDSQGQMEKVFRVWATPKQEFLPSLEGALFVARYVIKDDGGEPLGRLHVTAQPAVLRTDNSPIIALNLTARGRPEGPGVDGVLRFLDRGRDWIVRAFDELTTPSMHAVWGKV